MTDFLTIAEQAVRDAGQKAMQMLHHAHVLRQKAFGDFVTDGDVTVEEDVISSLLTHFPDHGFDSEERDKENAGAEYVWILDPIDGTKYYAKDVPLYAVSLALRRREEIVLGIVYMPEMDRMYTAEKGRGATLNGQPIHCSSEPQLASAHLCVEIPSRDVPEADRGLAFDRLASLVQNAYRVRVLGVASVGLCFCAAGGFDAYANLGSIWKRCDNAAGELILREAGGEFALLGRHVVAGPAPLCRQIREVTGL
jgi:myo-inositol-1(or 4)-monophosphatase